MNINETLRKLARSDKYLSIYSLSKDMPSLRLFSNTVDFTDIQLSFLRYLSFYNAIHTDIILGDVIEQVLDNDIYCDAYMMYKNKMDKLNKKIQSYPQQEKKEKNIIHSSQWVFKKSPKKVLSRK
jgi:hypothetical protein